MGTNDAHSAWAKTPFNIFKQLAICFGVLDPRITPDPQMPPPLDTPDTTNIVDVVDTSSDRRNGGTAIDSDARHNGGAAIDTDARCNGGAAIDTPETAIDTPDVPTAEVIPDYFDPAGLKSYIKY